MRAIYLKENLENKVTITISDELAHHLNVVRLKINEEVLVINGRGLSAKTIAISVNKREIILEVKEVFSHQPKHKISIAVGMPKKDAFEDIIKIATELGVVEIYPLITKYSQYNYKHSDRIDKLIESALIQSNNMYFPIIHEEQKLGSFLETMNTQLVYFSSRPTQNKCTINSLEEVIILIGPEGGFSLEEESEIIKNSHANQIHLPTPILKAPTAVATSIGYLLSNLF